MSIGTLADPDYYLEARHQLELGMQKSLEVSKRIDKEFAEIFGREYNSIDAYKCEDADIVLVAMGSLCGTIREIVDDLRDEGEKVGMLKIRTYRPFPTDDIIKALDNASKIAVLDKSISFGMGGIIYTDLKTKIPADVADIYGFVLGLGGRDITPKEIREVYDKTKNPTQDVTWIGLKEGF
jgi:pyruvate ferredoxin oxidoreductase alpha subunit